MLDRRGCGQLGLPARPENPMKTGYTAGIENIPERTCNPVPHVEGVCPWTVPGSITLPARLSPGARVAPCSDERWASPAWQRSPASRCRMPKRPAVDSADRASRPSASDRCVEDRHATSPATAQTVSASVPRPESATPAIPISASAFPIDRIVPGAAKQSTAAASAAAIQTRPALPRFDSAGTGIPGNETGG
jgi:hypothetical protein